MGTLILEIPTGTQADLLAELEQACVAGGQEGMPFSTRTSILVGQLLLTRDLDESGFLISPWQIGERGRFLVSSATLMERPKAYHLTMELARGKVNQVRCQASDWLMGGLLMSDPLSQAIRQASRSFGKVVACYPGKETSATAQVALHEGFAAAEQLIQAYTTQVFQVRHARQPRFDSAIACRLTGNEPAGAHLMPFLSAFNTVVLPVAWRDIEPTEGAFQWESSDRLVQWATEHNLRIVGGPLVDFSGRNLPDWIWERELDLNGLLQVLSTHIDRVVRRYPQIRSWRVTAGSNCSGVLAQRDEELLWLTVRLIEAVRKIGPQLDVVVGLAQPWGDYLAEQQRTQSPFLFADTLMRTGLKISGIDLEIIMGITPRGSYCRDQLDLSRLLDLYALLGVPLQVTLGYPSAPSMGSHCDPDLRTGAGWWREGYTPEAQADWVGAFASLVLCKPFVRGLDWTHFSDAEPHQFPSCGLVDAAGKLKPAMQQLARLRAEHLR